MDVRSWLWLKMLIKSKKRTEQISRRDLQASDLTVFPMP